MDCSVTLESPSRCSRRHRLDLMISVYDGDDTCAAMTGCNANYVETKDQRKRRHKRKDKNNRKLDIIGPTARPLRTIILLSILLWFGILAYSHNQLNQVLLYRERLEEAQTEFASNQLRERTRTIPLYVADGNKNNEASETIRSASTMPRFLIFEGDKLIGQGAGNILNGLLATHLLGEEYNRIVCVSPNYKGFHEAFEAIYPDTIKLCSKFFDDHPAVNDGTYKELTLVNYMSPPDECELQRLLASEQERVIYVQSNTYPRWRAVPPNFFNKFYKAKKELLDLLPFDPKYFPKTVVHLRLEDGRGDQRKGLDEQSLKALGELLSSKDEPPYLVTNNVPYYDTFEPYGWTHPNWNKVTHSALRKTWGGRTKETEALAKKLAGGDALERYTDPGYKSTQNLQMWADWFSILNAKEVYHTHSDFSLSAIHWMGSSPETKQNMIWSRTLQGIDTSTGRLDLIEESWVREAIMKPVVDRRQDELQKCKSIEEYKTQRPERISIKLNDNVQQDFMFRHLAIDDEQKQQMEEWRREMEGDKQNDSQAEKMKLSPEEITALVSSAQRKRQEEWAKQS